MLLNVRDRRIEAKIAYIGARGAGKATNFEKLGGDPTGDSLSLDWRPATANRFRDCDVFVKLVAERAEPTADALRDVLRDADGVVFVADSDPSTHERTQRVLDLARAAIAALGRADVPVVVQINKRDLEGAPPAAAVLDAIGGADLPHVVATAARGDGVIETAERALEGILAALDKGEPALASDPKLPPRVEGNPLLTALRQVLRETVSEHVAQLESRNGDAITRLSEQVRELQLAVEALAVKERTTLPTPIPAAPRDSMARSLDTLGEHVAAQRESAAYAAEKLEAILKVVTDLSDDMKRRKWGWFR